MLCPLANEHEQHQSFFSIEGSLNTPVRFLSIIGILGFPIPSALIDADMPDGLLGVKSKYLNQPFTPVIILTRIDRNTIPKIHGIDRITLRVEALLNWARKTIRLTIPAANRNEKI